MATLSSSGEERLPWAGDGDRVDGPHARGDDLTRTATVPVDRLGQGDGEVDQPLGGVGERHHRDDRVAVGHLDRHPTGEQVGLDGVAVGPRAGQDEGQPHRVDPGAVEHDETCHAGESLANPCHRLDHRAEQGLAVALEERPGGVGARQDGARRAGRGGRLDGGVEPGPADPAALGEHEGALRPGRQGLVGAGDEGVGAGREGVRRQGRVEPEVGAPRGIHDEGDAVPRARPWPARPPHPPCRRRTGRRRTRRGRRVRRRVRPRGLQP